MLPVSVCVSEFWYVCLYFGWCIGVFGCVYVLAYVYAQFVCV